MRLLFTTSYFLPYISGLTVYVDRIGRELAGLGYQIDILTTRHDRKLPKTESYNGMQVTRLPYLIKVSKGFFLPTYLWDSFKAVWQADVVIVNLPQFEGFIPAFWGKLLGKKVFCIYNCEVFLPKGPLSSLIEKAILMSGELTVKLTDKIITYTEDYAQNCRVLPKYLNKVVAVYPPIPHLSLDLKFKKSLENRIHCQAKYLLGVAARISAEKGIEYLLEAIPLIEEELGGEIEIAFAGPEDPVGEASYKKKISPLIEKFQSKLHFSGTLNTAQMAAFYSLIDLLVLPSINSTEAFGMVQVEAMLAGVPVVATDLPGVRVPVKVTGAGEIAKIRNSRDLAEKIALVLKNRARYQQRTGQAASEFALPKTVGVYDQLLRSLP